MLLHLSVCGLGRSIRPDINRWAAFPLLVSGHLCIGGCRAPVSLHEFGRLLGGLALLFGETNNFPITLEHRDLLADEGS